MTIPVLDFLSRDHSNLSVWTPGGGLTYGDDGLSGISAIGDGVNNVNVAAPIFKAGSGAEHTMMFGFKNTGDKTTARTIFAQFDNGDMGNGVIDITVQSTAGTVQVGMFSAGLTDRIKTQGVTDKSAMGAQEFLTIRTKEDEADIFFAGLEETYGLHNQVIGAGWSGVKTGAVSNVSVLQELDGVNPLPGFVGMIAYWKLYLTDAEILEAYNARATLAMPVTGRTRRGSILRGLL